MKTKLMIMSALALAAVTAFAAFGCTLDGGIDTTAILCRDNEIMSYERVDTSKQLITISNNINANTAPLIEALEKKYDIEVIETVGSSAKYLEQQAAHDDLSDIIFSTREDQLTPYFYDFSADNFTARYNQSSLSDLQIDGKIYQLPVAGSGHGIFYNKTLFTNKGWKVPETIDEFYTLCDTITADGIRAFAPCLKYAATVADVATGMSNREIFKSIQSATEYYSFVAGTHSSEGVLEPFLNSLRTLYTKGIINDDDFTSSATTIRKAMYEGTVAMVPYSLNLVSYYDDEKPDCELGFMGFPTETAGQRYMSFSSESTCLALSKKAMEDINKHDLLLEIMDFLTTNDGQDVLFQCFTGLSSIKSYQSNFTGRFDEVYDCINNNRLYFPRTFWTNDDIPTILSWTKGEMQMSEMLKAVDAIVARKYSDVPQYEVIGKVTETFSLVETCGFMADCFKETTGADIALVLNNTMYCGLIMRMYSGDFDYPAMFYLRGIDGKKCLAVHDILGSKLKELMEHPYVYKEEVNATYIPSGLKMTYAPWRDMDRNVLSLTLADGTPIEDDKIYKVAAWESSIDERYYSNITRFEDINNSTNYMRDIIKEKGTLTPNRDGRITLDWS